MSVEGHRGLGHVLLGFYFKHMLTMFAQGTRHMVSNGCDMRLRGCSITAEEGRGRLTSY